MKITCPHCHREFERLGNGRPRINIGRQKVLPAVQAHATKKDAAKELGISTRTLNRILHNEKI